MKFIIMPCLLGFDVKVHENNYTRSLGIFSDFGAVIELLMKNWKLDFTVELR